MNPHLQASSVSGFASPLGSVERQQAIARSLCWVLGATLLTVLIIGPSPFAIRQANKAAISQSGNAFNQLVIVLSFAVAMAIGCIVASRVLLLLRRSWLLGLILVWWSASFLWASHPELVMRRSVAFGMVYMTLLVTAACARSTDDLLRPLVVMFGLATILNVFTWQALPAASWSPIGETGIFDNKNSAGTIASLALIVLGCTLATTRSRIAQVLLLGMLVIGGSFLVATKSKTSIGLAGIMVAIGPALFLFARSPPAVRLMALLGCFTIAAYLYFGLSAAGLGETDLRLLIFGDLTFTGRTEIWTHIVQEIARRPWVGYGFGSFWDIGAVVNPIRSAPPEAWFMDAQLINTAHNGFLDVWLQNGLIGLALAIAAILRCFWLLVVEANAAPNRREKIVLVTALCLAISIVFNNFLESYLFRTGDTLGYLFVFILLHAESTRLRRQSASRGALA